MINTLGLLEVDGIAAAVDAADAMLKAANVCLFSHEALGSGQLTLVAEGDLATYRTTLDAGGTATARMDRAISCKEIGRPDDDTQWLIGGFKRQPKKPEQKSEVKIEVKPEKTQDAPVTSESSAQLLVLLALVR